MRMELDFELLNQLLGVIEEAWREQRDRLVAYRLAESHPEYREALLEFFDDLVLGPDKDVSADVVKSEARISAWIESTGIAAALAAAARVRGTGSTTPGTPSVPAETKNDLAQQRTGGKPPSHPEVTTWLMLLKTRLNRRLPELAAALPNVTPELLVLASRHPNLLPAQARTALAASVEEHLNVSAAESMRFLEDQPAITRAASRAGPFVPEPISFDELLERAALSPEQKAFWIAYGDRA